MIAYADLSAALERWRIRNGLPPTPPLFADGRGAAPPPPPARATQAIAAAPPPPPAPAAQPVRSPPPPPSGRQTVMGMPAPVVPVAAPTAAMALVPPPPDDEAADLGEADVLEESGDPYDNAGNDFAVGFEGEEQTRAEAGKAGDGWPEAKTVSSYGWGAPAPAPARSVEVHDDDAATHIGDTTRHD